MSNIDKIRQEIERRKDELERDKYINIDAKACRQSELGYLERFIDSLPEKLPGDLEEAADNYIAPIENDEGLSFIGFCGQDIKDAFIAGAEWQKAKDDEPRAIASSEHLPRYYGD